MKRIPARSPGAPGFTLIELMVTIAIVGIFMALIVPVVIRTQRMSESEIALQKAVLALRAETEIMHLVPNQDLVPGETVPFADMAGNLGELVNGRGEIIAQKDPARPGLITVTLTVFWDDPWKGPSAIHTILYRNAGGP